jgi:acyl-coenzyme A synthetase/AMP-(fatty) acid ligase
MATLANALPQNSSVAVIVPNKPNPITLTYGQLVEQTFAFQRKLAALGIEKGHAVSIALPNSLEFIVRSYLRSAPWVA